MSTKTSINVVDERKAMDAIFDRLFALRPSGGNATVQWGQIEEPLNKLRERYTHLFTELEKAGEE